MRRGRLLRALQTSPGELARRFLKDRRTHAADAIRRATDARIGTHGTNIPGNLARLLSDLPLFPGNEDSARAADSYCDHRFDLLGSGWTRVRYGMRCAGLEGISFGPTIAQLDLANHDLLQELVNPSNLFESRRIWSLLPPDYCPIDWQLDFKSGYRWDARTWYRDVKFGAVRGADVKVPWELSRLQHLPQLAIQFGESRSLRIRDEIRGQLLDWIAMNPPRFGVNWHSTMDVAIRAVSMLLSVDLLRAFGAELDSSFDEVFRRSIRDHAVHILENLEWSDSLRGNHYLSNIGGLAFCAAYLPPDDETNSWLDFASAELETAVREQFYPDGSNFEASACYHRLSAEIVVYTAAILERSGRRLQPGWKLDSVVVERIGRMGEFTRAITKPSGQVWQLGDNDSGRFLRISPVWDHDGEVIREKHLDHSHLGFAIGALFGKASSPLTADSILVSALAGTALEPPDLAFADPRVAPSSHWNPETPAQTIGRTIQLPAAVGQPLELVSFRNFGVYVYRSESLFVGFRCGSVGQNGIGGHAHNDQLAIELCVNGEDLILDPGTYLYTPLPERRNDYRSVCAHSAPHPAGEEQAGLRSGLFRLTEPWEATCLEFSDEKFVGEIRSKQKAIRRTVTIDVGTLVITDMAWGCVLAVEDEMKHPPFSPGYGEQTGARENARSGR